MTFKVDFQKAQIKGEFDWQLSQVVNVTGENGEVVAKAEIEILTLNKHRGAKASFELLDGSEQTDWEIPLQLCFKKQNLTDELCAELAVKANDKAKSHILLEAISVKPAFRKKGLAKLLLTAIAEQYPKAQSIFTMSMPMPLFLNVDYCVDADSTDYYQGLALDQDTTSPEDLTQFFLHQGFTHFSIDENLLNAPLPYEIFITSPVKLTG